MDESSDFSFYTITYQGGTMPENIQNSILHLHLDEELQKYNLEGKWNDYIAVQKEVLRVLRAENFFNDNIVIHKESGMMIKVTPRGIRETFGNGKRFNTLPKHLKKMKVATILYIKTLLTTGNVLSDNVENYHTSNSATFAYISTNIYINDILYPIRITIKKKVNSNIFYIHYIDTK